VWVLLLIFLFAPAPFSEGADALETAFSRAASALSRGDLNAVEQGFRAVLKSQPNHVGALGNLGVIYSRAGRTDEATLFDDAIREYRKSRKLDESLPGVRTELARALVSLRDNDAAERELRGILKTQPSDADACYLSGALLVQQSRR
jgi:Flp pilus assembly protein TadD